MAKVLSCQETMMELSRKQLVENFYKTQMVYFILQRSHLPPPPPMLPALHQMPHFSQTLHPLLMNPTAELNFFRFVFVLTSLVIVSYEVL